MKQNIFISYSHADGESTPGLLNEVYDYFKSKSIDIKTFDSSKDIPAGEDFRKKIKAEIDAADAFVIVYSPNVKESQWVNYEAGMADALGKEMYVMGAEKAASDPDFMAKFGGMNIRLIGSKNEA